MDYSDSTNTTLYDKQIEFYDEVLLIETICVLLYENQVKLVISDEYCSDYGMDCKFDLPCLLEAFYNIIEGLIEKCDFDIEFYEQGREYFLSFVVSENTVEINVQYGYNVSSSMIYMASYDFVKKMFIVFYDSIFQYATKYIANISKNDIFIKWNNEVEKLKNKV